MDELKRIMNLRSRLPNNYCAIARFINPTIPKRKIYGVVNDFSTNKDIIDLLEQIADVHEGIATIEIIKPVIIDNESNPTT